MTTPLLSQVPPPLYAPEQPESAFTTDEGPVPLSKAVWEDAKDAATTGFGLLANLKQRSLNVENNIENKFVGFLLSSKATGNLGTAASAFISPPPKFLTKKEYEESDLKRPGVNFNDGVYENIATIEAKKFDNGQVLADLNSRTTQGTWSTIAKGAGSIAGGVADPLFWLLGGPVDEAIAPAAKYLSELLPEIKGLSPSTMSTLKWLGRKTISGGATAPVYAALGYAEQKAFQEPASVKSLLYSIPIGIGFSITHGAFGRVISSRVPELISKFAKDEKNVILPSKETEEVFQPVSQNSHEEMLKTSVAQMENGKIPEVGEIGKQNYHDDWQKTLGDQLREDPVGYHRDLENLKNDKMTYQFAQESIQKRLEIVEGQIDKASIASEKTNDFTQLTLYLEESNDLKTDTDTLQSKIEDIDDLISARSNVPEESKIEDVKTTINKMNNPQSDFTNFETKEVVPIPDEDQTANELLNRTKEEFNARKPTMDERVKADIKTDDIEERHNGIKKLIKGMQNCLRGGE